MMRFTLLSDGSSDTVLLSILSWLMTRHCRIAFEPQWADLRRLRKPPTGLADRILQAIVLYPCELLFVHRDAEREPRQNRVAEIREAIAGLEVPPVVCVVPVRMQEAWLLFDEAALRRAAGCPHGRMPLVLPPLDRLEQEPDPKQVLYSLLRQASGLSGRRLKSFRPQVHVHQLAQRIEDFSPLLQLTAFQTLDQELREVLAQMEARP